MKKSFAKWSALVAVIALLAVPAIGQKAMTKKAPPLSPPAKTECALSGGKTIHVAYSSPRMRGRKIYGGLVPYGKVWRAGANEATTFVVDTDVVVGGADVPAGNYTLFALPNADAWKLIISKKTGEWGIPYPGEHFDFTRVDMQLSTLPKPLEDFTISFANRGGACVMRLDWDTTRASVKITEKK